MINRNEALELVKQNVKRENLVKHMLAVEAIMAKCAEFLGENAKTWSLLGLLHDIDFDMIKDFKEHGIAGSELLKGKVDENILRAIKAHNFEKTGTVPESKMENCLIAADSVSGLIIAAALIIPSRKLRDVEAQSVSKKFKQKDFARNCDRSRILFCEKVGIEKEKFFEISLNGLKEIGGSLGL